MKKATVWILTIALCLGVFLTGCGSKADSAPAGSGSQAPAGGENARVKDTLVVATSTDPGNLSPDAVGTIANHRLFENIYDGLVSYGHSGKITGMLAEDFGWTDSLHYHIKLREGVKFSDGSDFNAEVAMFCMRIAAEKSTSKDQWKSVDFEKSTVDDNYNITLAFKEYNASFEDTLAIAWMFSKAAYESDPEALVTMPVCSGPYKVTDYVIGDSVTLEANEYYWGEAPKIKKIIWRIIPEKTQRMIELESGGVDFIFDIDGNAINEYKDNPGIDTSTTVSSATVCLMMNNSEYSVLHNQTLREAIAYAIDSVSIAENVYHGLAIPAPGCLSSYYQYYDTSLDGTVPRPYNLEKAKELMAEAGYPDGLDLVCYTDDNADRKAMIEIIQAELKEIGINLSFETYENVVRLDRIKDPAAGWDITLSIVGKDYTMWMVSYFMTSHGPNVTCYNNPEFEALYDELSASQDEARSEEIAKRMQQLFLEDLPFYPIAATTNGVAFNSKLENVQWWAKTFIRFDDMVLYE